MRWQRAARVLGLAASGVVLVHAATFVACIDGTTPDCSDAALQCGPDLDGATDAAVVEAALPEASPPTDAPNDTSPADAEPDADLDAGDEG